MNVRFLIDSIMRQTTVLIAQLATTAGVRAPLAHVANQVFLELVEAIEAQGIGKKVAADMFGLALRSYQQKVQRLSESSTDRGVTLWQAIYTHLQTHKSLSRADLMRRFSRDDESSVRGILHDLVETGLLYRSGRGDATLYRVVEPEELGDGLSSTPAAIEALTWITVYRQGPIDLGELGESLSLGPTQLERAIEALLEQGRIQRDEHDPDQYRSASCFIPLGEDAGWEAALFDHYQAVTTAIAHKLRNGLTRALPHDKLGGSTYSFNLWDDHPHAQEVLSLLSHTRAELSALWDKVHAHNQAHEPGQAPLKVTFYFGQNIQHDDLQEPHHEP